MISKCHQGKSFREAMPCHVGCYVPNSPLSDIFFNPYGPSLL